MKPDIQNIIKAVRMLEEIHQPEYRMWISMENISALCDEIERLTPEGNCNMNHFEKELSQLINSSPTDYMPENMPDFVLEKFDVPKSKGRTDYAYETIEEYEKIIGAKVNDAFRIGWDMARTTNARLKLLGAGTYERMEGMRKYENEIRCHECSHLIEIVDGEAAEELFEMCEHCYIESQRHIKRIEHKEIAETVSNKIKTIRRLFRKKSLENAVLIGGYDIGTSLAGIEYIYAPTLLGVRLGQVDYEVSKFFEQMHI